jgi:hypothetical protein
VISQITRKYGAADFFSSTLDTDLGRESRRCNDIGGDAGGCFREGYDSFFERFSRQRDDAECCQR